GIITGVMLSLARAGGETAPLLLTALGNQFFSADLLQPMASLPVQLYNYAVAPYDDWHTKAWGSALVLVFVVGCLSLITRLAARRARRGARLPRGRGRLRARGRPGAGAPAHRDGLPEAEPVPADVDPRQRAGRPDADRRAAARRQRRRAGLSVPGLGRALGG